MTSGTSHSIFVLHLCLSGFHKLMILFSWEVLQFVNSISTLVMHAFNHILSVHLANASSNSLFISTSLTWAHQYSQLTFRACMTVLSYNLLTYHVSYWIYIFFSHKSFLSLIQHDPINTDFKELIKNPCTLNVCVNQAERNLASFEWLK